MRQMTFLDLCSGNGGIRCRNVPAGIKGAGYFLKISDVFA